MIVVIEGKLEDTPRYSIAGDQVPTAEFWLLGEGEDERFIVRATGDAARTIKDKGEGTRVAVDGHLRRSDKMKSLVFVETDKLTIL